MTPPDEKPAEEKKSNVTVLRPPQINMTADMLLRIAQFNLPEMTDLVLAWRAQDGTIHTGYANESMPGMRQALAGCLLTEA